MLALFFFSIASCGRLFHDKYNPKDGLSKSYKAFSMRESKGLPISREWYDTSDGELHSYKEAYDENRNKYETGYQKKGRSRNRKGRNHEEFQEVRKRKGKRKRTGRAKRRNKNKQDNQEGRKKRERKKKQEKERKQEEKTMRSG